MTPTRIQEDQHLQRHAGLTVQVGGWLFRYRTMIPVPFFLALIFVRVGEAQASIELIGTGVAVVVAGECVRLWGVHHIGAISRTRSDRLGPLIADGPFAYVRNPLYLGNIVLWVGFALIARLMWMAPLLAFLLGLEYHAIVRWEEGLLMSRLGEAYRGYTARVPRWIPALPREGRGRRGGTTVHDSLSASSASSVVENFSWRQTFFSERGTLIAIAAGCVLLWLKARF
jgi:protein-S-isoprenylcysteine O-methyltransferase Ste14